MSHLRSSMLVVWIALLLAACGGTAGTESAGDGAAGATEDGAAGDAAASGETFTWDYFGVLPVNHPYTQFAIDFADDVRERTDGRLDITVRPAGELPYGADEVIDRVGDGSVEMGQGPTTFLAGDCPVTGVPSLPFLVASFDEYVEMRPVLEPYLNGCLGSYGAQLLYEHAFPNQNFFGSGEAPENLEDFEGLDIRQTGAESGEFITRIGGAPVTLTTADVPPAMQRGVMDALISSGLNVAGAGWQDFLDWAYILEMGVAPDYIIINSEAYDSLPEDLRTVLDETAAEYQEFLLEQDQQLEEEARQTLQDSGMEFVEASEADREQAVEMTVAFWEEWAAQSEDEDVAAAVADIREVLGK